MTREELKAHCKRQIEQFERIEIIMAVTPNDWKRYEEHKLVLELLEQEPILDKIRAEIEQEITYKPMEMWDYRMGLTKALEIIDKHKIGGERA